jgi:AAA+ superfamily predicted ATPase
MSTGIDLLGWHAENQRRLMDEVAHIRQRLKLFIATDPDLVIDEEVVIDSEPRQSADETAPQVWPLDLLCETFHLSAFERSTLMLCAAMELDHSIGPLCALAQPDPPRPYPTFGLALAALPDPEWFAITPDAPLRRWRLIEVLDAGSDSLTHSLLRIDERILHYLTGIQHLDARLAGLIEPLAAEETIAPSHQRIAERIALLWSDPDWSERLPVVQLCGRDVSDKRAIAAEACAHQGLNPGLLSSGLIPSGAVDGEMLARAWEREAVLGGSALVIDGDDLDQADPARIAATMRLLEHINGALILTTRERRDIPGRPSVAFDIEKPGTGEQRILWERALGDAVMGLEREVEEIVGQFQLSASSIATIATAELRRDDDRDLGERLWQACRTQSRPQMDDLSQRIDPIATWEDLVLPEEQERLLRTIALHVRHRTRVYEDWGFASRQQRGLGITALFTGSSGTGKTLAAEVLAHDLRLDLYRVDIGQVMSKYIGETEKNLGRMFDAAEDGGAVLLFDEADALFGRRSEVKDSHDRYANIEVSYLLQRMEAYRGLAILTTNLRTALDTAFLRRIRFVAEFPFPNPAQRERIWERMFPPRTLASDVRLACLAQLDIPGGNIRNIALNAAFLAADRNDAITMRDLLTAARSEYAKIEKPLTDAEIRGWL